MTPDDINFVDKNVWSQYITMAFTAASIWFEIWGVVDPGKKYFNYFPGKFSRNFDFFMQYQKKCRLFQPNFWKILTSRQFKKKNRFPGKNCLCTATSGQIILFLFKSHHFRTYFLNMIRYNNISRPPAKNLGVATPQHPRIDALGLCTTPP